MSTDELNLRGIDNCLLLLKERAIKECWSWENLTRIIDVGLVATAFADNREFDFAPGHYPCGLSGPVPGKPIAGNVERSDKKIKSTWRITVYDNDRIFANDLVFERLHEGKVIEIYRPATREEAAIYAAAITQGFEPPRHLVRQGKPFE